VGGFFYRESCRRRAYRESLSEACGVLDVLVIMAWTKRLERKLNGVNLKKLVINQDPDTAVSEAH